MQDLYPPSKGYKSKGIIYDMAIHWINFVLDLFGQKDYKVKATGFNVGTYQEEEYEGAPQELIPEPHDSALVEMIQEDKDTNQQSYASIFVSRKHPAGNCDELHIYGTKGRIDVNQFSPNKDRVLFNAFLADDSIVTDSYELGSFVEGTPGFLYRYKLAYERIMKAWVKWVGDEGWESQKLFRPSLSDGVYAMKIAEAANLLVNSHENQGKYVSLVKPT